MKQKFGLRVGSCLAVIAALLIVGAVSSGVIRHIVQTSPLWIAIRPSHYAMTRRSFQISAPSIKMTRYPW
jgi:hypothetical protein